MKKITIITSLIFAILLTGCNNKEPEEIVYGEIIEESIESTQESIQEPEIQEPIVQEPEAPEEPVEPVESEIIPEVSEEPSEEPSEEVIEERFIDTLENNISNDFLLNKITINGVSYSLPMPASELQELKECPFATAHHDTENYIFKGKGYGIQSNPEDPMSFDGSTIFFSTDDTEENFTGCIFSTFWQKEDLDVIFADIIKLGMPYDEVQEKLGPAVQNDGKFLYKNDHAIFVIEYDSKMVDEITIITQR